MKIELEIVKGYPHAVHRVAVDRPITIGRSRAADVQILSSLVSRLHCQIRREGDAWMLVDLESRNGTWVDSQRIQRKVLKVGDEFALGQRIVIRLGVPEQTHEIPAAADGKPRTCSFCLEPAGKREMVQDPEGNLYHVACRPLARLVGMEIDGVRIIERLPGTGESHRLRAHQPSLNRHVLLHAFDEEMMSAPGFRDKLLAEVRALSRLLHPHILQIHDLMEHKDTLLVVMEYFPGTQLDELLQKQRYVKIARAISISSQIAEAMAYAVDQGRRERCLLPRQVLVGEDGATKLDLFHPPGRASIAVGDLPYVAPELVSSGVLRHAVGRTSAAQATDTEESAVYGLGSILYHMLAGIPPFEGATKEQMLPKILKEMPPSLRRVNLKVSPALARIVERAMDKNPGGRPADFRSFHADLRKIIAPAL